jgi:hypothetical protein
MRTAAEIASQLEALMGEIGTLPLSEQWMYAAIRHCQRNMDFDTDDGGNEPDRYAGTALCQIANILPEIIAALRGKEPS